LSLAQLTQPEREVSIFDNGNLVVNQSFSNSAAAQAYFANSLLNIYLASGFNTVQLSFSEMMSAGEGFSFDYSSASISATPLRRAHGDGRC
jgi:hypothetical protein